MKGDRINPIKVKTAFRVKQFTDRLGRRDVFVSLIIILVGFAGFGLGRLSKLNEQKPPVRIESVFGEIQEISLSSQGGGQVLPASTSVLPDPSSDGSGLLVASKRGSKYHYPWCPGAQQMNEENKIWFNSREEAESAGYTPAANCKGL